MQLKSWEVLAKKAKHAGRWVAAAVGLIVVLAFVPVSLLIQAVGKKVE
jgi:hypothetical protein